MSAFDSDNPPDNYKDFRKSVIESIQSIELEADDIYPPALFLVGRDGEANIIFAFDVAESQNVPAQAVITNGFPNYIKRKNGKFFAVVFPGMQMSENSKREIITLLTGCIERTDCMIAEVERDEYNDTLEIEAWEKMDILKFGDFVADYRRSICLQG